jgi:hypothetical protein
MMGSRLKLFWQALSRWTSRKREAPAYPTERAPRYQVEMPLRFRRRGESDWQDGTMVNISLSGVLFRAEQMMEEGTPVEMNFVLPPEIGWEPGGVVLWPAQIVRAVPPTTTDALPVLAAKILEPRPRTRLRADPRNIAQDDRGPLARA